MKGGIPLSSQGTIIARVFTSNARIPLRGAAVVFYRTDAGGVRELLGLRLTNYDGMTDPRHPDASGCPAHSHRAAAGAV